MIYIDNWNNYKLATKTCIQNIKIKNASTIFQDSPAETNNDQ